MASTGITSYLGLLILGTDFVLLSALTAALLDIIPVFGPGLLFIPWILYNMFRGRLYLALGLLIIYTLVTAIRQGLEGKIMGLHLGLHPLLTMIAFYIGYRLLGPMGFIIGPGTLVLWKAVWNSGLFPNSLVLKNDTKYNTKFPGVKEMKKLVLLGSTGSIGTQSLDVIDSFPEEWEVLALSANSNIDLLEKQARKYRPLYLVIGNNKLQEELEYRLDDLNIKVLSGAEGLEFIAGELEADLVINSIVGAAGLKPTIAALKAGRRLGLANKESLVIGGEIIARDYPEGVILPIDSEHNAIFQILEGEEARGLKILF